MSFDQEIYQDRTAAPGPPGHTITGPDWVQALDNIAAAQAAADLVALRAFDVEAFVPAAASVADAWQAAIDSAFAAGGKVITRTASQTLTKGIDTRGVPIEGPGSGTVHLEWTSDATPVDGPSNGCMVYAGGTLTNIGGVASNIAKHAKSLTLSTATSLDPGDWLIIYNSANSSFNAARTVYRAGEWVQVKSVSGATVTLTLPTYAAYTAGSNITIQKVNPVRPSITGLRMTFRSNQAGIRFDLAENPRLDDLVLTGSDHAHVQLKRCVNVALSHIYVWDASPVATPDALNYGVAINNCQNIDIDSCFLETTRHGLTTGGGDYVGCVPVRNLTVRGGRVSSNGTVAHAMGLDMHGNIEYAQFLDVDMPHGVMLAGDHTVIRGRVRSGPAGSAIMARELIGWDHEIDVDLEITENTLANYGWIHLFSDANLTRTDGHLRIKANINGGSYGAASGTHLGCYIYNVGGEAGNDVDIDLTVKSTLPDLGTQALALWLRASAGSGFRDVDISVRAKRMGAIVECSPRMLTRHDCDIYQPPVEGLRTLPISSPIWTDTRLRSYNNRVRMAGLTGIYDALSGNTAGEIISDNDDATDCNRLATGTSTTGTAMFFQNAKRVIRRNAKYGDTQSTTTQTNADAVHTVAEFIDVAPLRVGTVTGEVRTSVGSTRTLAIP